MMVAALVLVAASAIFQTAIGLSADKLGAAQSQRMFATVVAASGSVKVPKVEQYAKQLRKLEINENGRARVGGVVKSVASKGFSVETWGGEWKVVYSLNTKVVGQRGKLDIANIKEGDFVAIEGIAENSGAAVVSAQVINDFTAYRVPETEAAKRVGEQSVLPATPVTGMPSGVVPVFPTLPTKAPAAREMNVSAAQSVTITPPGVVEVGPRGGDARKAVMQKSMDLQ